MKKKTLVLGASPNPERYAYKAVQRLKANGHPVVAVGIKPGTIDGIDIQTDQPIEEEVDTVSIYVRPDIQEGYYDYIFAQHPQRLIFNPGTENPVLSKMATEKGIVVENSCTLVLLGTAQY